MSSLQFVKLSPTQNVTVLVTSPVPRAHQAAVAARLLAYDGVGGEQVGYLEAPADARARARLQMMGGEFCGNASMALAAWLCARDGLADGAEAEVLLEVSGGSGLTPCRVRRSGSLYRGTVRLPPPACVTTFSLPLGEVPLVAFPGISHLILPAGLNLDEATLRRALPRWNERIGADALGAILWDEANQAIDPLVYVPSAGTLVRERGCGSGTAAVGCHMALRAGRPFSGGIRQSGGVIEVSCAPKDGRVDALAITGDVRIVAAGEAWVED